MDYTVPTEVPSFVDDDDNVIISRAEYNGYLKLLNLHYLLKSRRDRGYEVQETKRVQNSYFMTLTTPYSSKHKYEDVLNSVIDDLYELYHYRPTTNEASIVAESGEIYTYGEVCLSKRKGGDTWIAEVEYKRRGKK